MPPRQVSASSSTSWSATAAATRHRRLGYTEFTGWSWSCDRGQPAGLRRLPPEERPGSDCVQRTRTRPTSTRRRVVPALACPPAARPTVTSQTTVGSRAMSIDFEIPKRPRPFARRSASGEGRGIPPREDHDKATQRRSSTSCTGRAPRAFPWMPFVPGVRRQGLGLPANALVQMELGESYVGALHEQPGRRRHHPDPDRPRHAAPEGEVCRC